MKKIIMLLGSFIIVPLISYIVMTTSGIPFIYNLLNWFDLQLIDITLKVIVYVGIGFFIDNLVNTMKVVDLSFFLVILTLIFLFNYLHILEISMNALFFLIFAINSLFFIYLHKLKLKLSKVFLLPLMIMNILNLIYILLNVI